MKNSLGEGGTLSVTAPYALASGAGCRIGGIFGVAVAAYDSGATAQIKTGNRVSLAKATGEVWAVGDRVFWDNTAKKCTKTATSPNAWIGMAMAAALTGDTTGVVNLFPGFCIQDPAAASG